MDRFPNDGSPPLAAGGPWPVPASEGYEFTDPDLLGNLAFQVLIGWQEGSDEPLLVGLTFRVLGQLEPSPGHHGAGVSFADPIPTLSWREASRLPVGTIVRAAVSLAASRRAQHRRVQAEGGSLPMFDPEVTRAIAESLPPGRPQRGKGTAFYKGIADAYTKYDTLGLHPSSEIAKAKKVAPGTARQWVHQARRLGLLPPAKEGRKL